MRYIESVKIIGNSYPSNKMDIGYEFKCEDINLFVGNQGCGKSTMLNMLFTGYKDLEIILYPDTQNNEINAFFFDTEKDNPRIKDPISFTSPSRGNKGIGFKSAVMTNFASHGQVMEKFTISPLLKAKDCVIFLDEPESGLSITNQFRLIEAINVAITNNCQIFIATHCYPLIESLNVISLEHYKQMTGKEFINLVKY